MSSDNNAANSLPPASASSPTSSNSSNEEWTDVTSRLHSAASLLPRGYLLHHSSFSLHQSMSATEIGDPKMDASQHVPRDVMTYDKALERGIIVAPEKLTLYQQLEIIDELLACETTSMTGSVLAYTVYTCIYLHRLSTLESTCPLLYAYFLMTLKSLELVRSIITKSGISTEEEFAYSTNSIRFGEMNIPANYQNPNSTAAAPTPHENEEKKEEKTDASVNPATTTTAAASSSSPPLPKSSQPYKGMNVEEILLLYRLQDDAIEKKLTQLRAAAVAADPSFKPDTTVYGPATPDSSELHLYTLLQNRFDFRYAWYHFHLLLRRRPYWLKSNLDAVREYEEELKETLTMMKQTMNGSSWKIEEEKRVQEEMKHRETVKEMMAQYTAATSAAAAASSSASSIPEPTFPKPPPPYLGPRTLTFGFDPSITKCLVQYSPPKVVSIYYRSDAICFYEEFLLHFQHLKQLAELTRLPTTIFHDILHWFEEFHELGSNILLRSHIWLWMKGSGETMAEWNRDMFRWLYPPFTDNKLPVAGVSVETKVAAVKASAAAGLEMNKLGESLSHSNTKELLLKSHGDLCASIKLLAAEYTTKEQDRKKTNQPSLPWDPKDPFTYGAFIDRCITPYSNMFQTLLGSISDYRKKTIMNEGGVDETNPMHDWNILQEDGRHIDQTEFHTRMIVGLEEKLVNITKEHHAQRHQHAGMLYPFNCTSLILDQTYTFLIRYILSGLETSLYTSKELPTLFFLLDHYLNGKIENRIRYWRDEEQVFILKKKHRSLFTSALVPKLAATKKKLQFPSEIPVPKIEPNLTYLLVQAQFTFVRGMIQLLQGLKRVKVDVKQAGDSDATEQVNAIIVPDMDKSLASTWYSHRFSPFSSVRSPPVRSLHDYLTQVAMFDTLPNGAPEIMTLAQHSFQKVKEEISYTTSLYGTQGQLSQVFKCKQMNQYQLEYVKLFLKVCVTNMLICVSHAKMAQQVKRDPVTGQVKKLRVEYKWEKMSGGSTFVTQHSSRVFPFPIVQLVLEK